MSEWRKRYKVHPAADVFPMMTDAELRDLADDILKHGQQMPIQLWLPGDVKDDLRNARAYETALRSRRKLGYGDVDPLVRDAEDVRPVLLDGRNRLAAFEILQRLLKDNPPADADELGDLEDTVEHGCDVEEVCVDQQRLTEFICSLNLKRRHLTKAQQAEMIVKAVKASKEPLELDVTVPTSDEIKAHNKPRQFGEVSKGGRGKVNEVKAEAIKIGKPLSISQRTFERVGTPTPTAPRPPTEEARRARAIRTLSKIEEIGATVGELDMSSLWGKDAYRVEKAYDALATIAGHLNPYVNVSARKDVLHRFDNLTPEDREQFFVQLCHRYKHQPLTEKREWDGEAQFDKMLEKEEEAQ